MISGMLQSFPEVESVKQRLVAQSHVRPQAGWSVSLPRQRHTNPLDLVIFITAPALTQFFGLK